MAAALVHPWLPSILYNGDMLPPFYIAIFSPSTVEEIVPWNSEHFGSRLSDNTCPLEFVKALFAPGLGPSSGAMNVHRH